MTKNCKTARELVLHRHREYINFSARHKYLTIVGFGSVCFKNLTKTPVFNEEISFFSRGPTFCPTLRHINWPDILADIYDFSIRMRLNIFIDYRKSINECTTKVTEKIIKWLLKNVGDVRKKFFFIWP